jgi:hypothetical protein
MSIAPDVRVSDLVHVLSDPVAYIRGILRNFDQSQHDPADSVIRVGTTGAGFQPNYKIERPSAPATFNVGHRQFTMTVTPADTFSGRDHREMMELGDHPWHSKHWSSAMSTLAELQALLTGLLRGAPRAEA